MESIKKKFTETVNFDDIGEMKEYIGTKINTDCCTPRTIDTKPCAMDMKRSRHDHWGRLGKVPTHASRALHMYVCASTMAPRPSQKPLHDTFLCS